jgi:hypothetical protein
MRTRPVGILAAIGCAASLLLPGTALADTLDQQQPVGGNDARIQSDESLAQTFTAGLTGGLDRVELLLGAPDSVPTDRLTVEIRNVAGGSPAATVLATGSVPPSAVSSTDAWIPITFGTAVPLTAGTQYTIVAYSDVDNAHSYFWALEFEDPYPAGANFTQTVSPPIGTWTPTTFDSDQAFKTYVEVPAPPAGPPAQSPAGKKKCKKHKKGKKEHRGASAAKKKCKKKKKKRK